MRSSILITLLVTQAFSSVAQFTSDTVSRFITTPQLLPPPYEAGQATTAKIPVTKGRPGNDIFSGDAVFFNPAEAIHPAPRTGKTGSRAISPFIHLAFNRFYLPGANWPLTVTPVGAFQVFAAIPKPGTEELERWFRPFWLKKCEVTNAEYRAFVNAVKDSVIRHGLAKHDARYADAAFPVTFTPRELDSLVPGMMLTPDNRIFGRIEFDVTKFIYRYTDDAGVVQQVPVYPDTLVWMNDPVILYGEPMVRRYFSHPAFRDYPVGGVNFFQAKAYCHWLTRQLQEQWQKQYGFTVMADLPFEYERAFVTNRFTETPRGINWLTRLCAIEDVDHSWSFFKPRELDRLVDPAGATYSNRLFGTLKTHPADVDRLLHARGKKSKPKLMPDEADYLRRQVDENGISGLDDNLSEWMNESFIANWRPVYEKRKAMIGAVKLDTVTRLDSVKAADFFMQHLPLTREGLAMTPELFGGIIFHNMMERRVDSLEAMGMFEFNRMRQDVNQPDTSRHSRTDMAVERQVVSDGNPFHILETTILQHILYYKKEMPLLRRIEDYFYAYNDADGRLVRGGNWFDAPGADARVFISPHKASSMIGFRYVIRLVPLTPAAK